MSRIILMAESGSDITPEQAKQNGIVIVPMHVFFFFNDPATTEIYTLSLHDALPIWCR